MEAWLEFLRGPVFRFALVVAVLGLVRHFVLGVLGAVSAYRRANDKNVPWRQLAVQTAGWVIPVKRLFTSERKVHGFLSFLLHVGVIVAPLFFLDHLLLWSRGLGVDLSFLALPKILIDHLTLLAVAAALGLILSRALSRTARSISGSTDYFLLILIVVLFMSGFVASRPWNPVSWEASMLIHVATGNLILLLMPFTKLAHIVLFPWLRLTGEVAWKFPSRAGEEVALTLEGKEVRPI